MANYNCELAAVESQPYTSLVASTAACEIRCTQARATSVALPLASKPKLCCLLRGGAVLVLLFEVAERNATTMMVSRPRSPPQRELASSPSLEPADLKQGLCQRRALDHGFDALLACAACRGPIRERFYLQALDQPWHTGCLRCSLCGTGLDSQASCFAREGRIYCRDDYLRAFVRCCACGAALSPRDLVMRVRGGLAFHVGCFRCASCLCPLLKGDVYGMRDNSVFCKLHFQDTTLLAERNKRMRTSFKHSQLRAMKAYFTVNHNPDSKDLKQLSLRTGLSKRVLQVWFQNARAKWRRNLLRQASHGPEIAQDSSPLQDLGATITLEEQTIHSYANLF